MEFEYQAINGMGALVSGRIKAMDEREAARQLEQQSLTPVHLQTDETDPALQATPWQLRKGVTTQEKTTAILELSTLLLAGVPLAEAVESLGHSHQESGIGKAFLSMHHALRSGNSVTYAIRESGIQWPAYLLQLVEAGEQTGKLGDALTSAAIQMEYDDKVRRDIQSSLAYPIILIVSGIAAILLVFVVVVPRFSNMLKSTHADLPALSVWVLKTGMFVSTNLTYFGIASAVFIVFGIFLLGNRTSRAAIYDALSRMPFIGRWIMETEIGRWAAIMGTMLENRVPILKAMELAENGTGLRALESGLQQCRREVRRGVKLAEALASMRMLTPAGINLIKVGERSGALAGMLQAMAAMYGNASRERMKRFLVLIEPVAILLIGTVIGIIMVAIMLAITSMSNVRV